MLSGMEFSKCLQKSLLRIAILLAWSFKGFAQNSSSTSSPPSSSAPPTSWTILSPGYLVFYPDISQHIIWDFKLSFKTKQPHGLLFCHVLKDYVKEEHVGLNQYEFCTELYQGYLRVQYQLNNFPDEIKLGEGLNNDRWHHVQVTLDTVQGQLSITVDRLSQTHRLRAFTWLDTKRLLDWNTLPSMVVYGGIKDLMRKDHEQFVGCLRDLSFVTPSGEQVPVMPADTRGAKRGCRNLCATANKCHPGTSCINHYTNIVCDCFGSDHEGKYCEIPDASVVTLHGYEWITHTLYRRPKDRLRTDSGVYSLQFKSNRGSGVLIYAVGGAPSYTHVIASVHNGIVQASVGFGSEVLEARMGFGVDDYNWHNLTIVHSKHLVDFILDGVHVPKTMKGDDHFLNLDRKIYFGGGDNFVTTRGLQVTQNFVGCLKNVYVNEVSILHQLRVNNTQSILNGGSNVQFGCQEVDNIPMSFPKSGSMLLFDQYQGNDLVVDFHFRTVRKNAVLLYFNLITPRHIRYTESGSLEVLIRNGQPYVYYVPSLRNQSHTRNTSIALIVDDNRWHNMRLEFTAGELKVKMDSMSVVLQGTGTPRQISGEIFIGFGPKAFTENNGFVGCIRNLVLQKDHIDPITLMDNRDVVDGVFLDGCHLIDHCKGGPHCHHGGQCLSDWDGITCDCSKTAYDGKTCHFPKYKKSCDSYYRAGITKSGVYQIDLDGVGDMDPAYVKCVMEYDDKGDKSGQTIVEHNLYPNTVIREVRWRDLKKVLSYRGMDHRMLMELTRLSSQCEQYIQYDCFNAPLRLGELTSFKAANGRKVQYLGTDRPGYCNCSDQSLCPASGCMCDRGKSSWSQDSGYNRVKEQLPITEITVLQQITTSLAPQNATVTLGPLKCWGNSKDLNPITFTTHMSHVTLAPWTTGDLRFSYRTHQVAALILHQSAANSSDNYLTINQLSATWVRFLFRVNRRQFMVDIRTSRPLNTGTWQVVSVERSMYDIRCSVADQQKIVQIPSGNKMDRNLFSARMYLGGVSGDLFDETPGLVGCVGGFEYNQERTDLSKYLDSRNQGVTQGCTASCWANPCKHGGTCIEQWGSYQCICANQWAHSGHSCETNINEDAVTFDGTSSSFLEMDIGRDSSLLESQIVLSFRTLQQRGLLFYLYDNYNNFLQLELTSSNTLKLSYNQLNEIINGTLVMHDIKLSDGQWRQVIIKHLGDDQLFPGVQLMLENNFHVKTINYRTLKLNKFINRPFSASRVRQTVFPPRNSSRSSDYMRLYVGGADPSVTNIPTLIGCIRGFKIGSTVFDLEKASLAVHAVSRGCESGCSPQPCKNGGNCWERWGRRDFHCDCTNTDYAGTLCHIEASGKFVGDNVLEYQYTPNGAAQSTRSERISLMFQTNVTHNQPMTLLTVMSTGPNHGYITIYMMAQEGVYASINPGVISHGIALQGKFADGKPHRLVYHHFSESEMSMTLDMETRETVSTPDSPIEDLDTIMVGGIVQHRMFDNFARWSNNFKDFTNFTGCLSHVKFEPVADNRYHAQLPLKALRDFNNGSVIVYGRDIEPCSTPINIPLTSDRPTTTTLSVDPNAGKLQEMMMPPWNPGPADTVYIGPPPVVITTTFPTTAVQTTNQTTTAAPPRSNLTNPRTRPVLDSGGMDHETLAIVLCIIIFLLLVALLIAIILSRMRKKHSYTFKQKEKDDYEMKQPLNHLAEASPPVSPDLKDQHIARLDEFSMVSATLGPSMRRTENGIKPGVQPLLADEDTPQEYTMQTFFNKKKNRPASSISEVLEEMERQRRAKEGLSDVEKDAQNSPQSSHSKQHHGEGDLEWDPQTDKTPLTCDFVYKYLPQLPLSMTEEDEDQAGSDISSSSSSYSFRLYRQKPELEDVDTDSDPLKILEQQDDLAGDYNGDSGYEAESRKGGDGLGTDTPPDSITPPSPSPKETAHLMTPLSEDAKMYMYDIAGFQDEGSPQCSSTPRKTPVGSREVVT